MQNPIHEFISNELILESFFKYLSTINKFTHSPDDIDIKYDKAQKI